MKKFITLLFAVCFVFGLSGNMSANTTVTPSGSSSGSFTYGTAYELNSYYMSAGSRRYKLSATIPSGGSLTVAFYGNGYIIRKRIFTSTGSEFSNYSIAGPDYLKIGAENNNPGTLSATVGWNYNY